MALRLAKNALPMAMLFAIAILPSCSKSGGPLPPDHRYAVQLCIPEDQWPRLISSVQAFGVAHGLTYYREIEPTRSQSHSPAGTHMDDTLNITLVRGLHQLGDDDFDLWIVSDPFRKGQLQLAALARQKITPEQIGLANSLRDVLVPISCSRG